MNRTIFTLAVAWKMLPLVSRIAKDIADNNKTRRNLRQERKTATDRKQQYTLDDDIKDTERRIQENTEELESLGLDLLDKKVGKVGWPTIVNNSEAYFTWEPGSPTFLWQFVGDETQHALPKDWLREIPTT